MNGENRGSFRLSEIVTLPNQQPNSCLWLSPLSLLDFSFPLFILLSLFLGFCLSFPVLTHGSWGTVRHLLAFAPANPPTGEQAHG